MGEAEIERGNALGIGRQIGKDVAPARGDGNDMAIGPERQRREIDLRVFPDLGVNEPAKQPLEQALQKSLPAQCPVAADGLFEAQFALSPRIDQSRDSTLETIDPTYWVSVPVS